jgi:hypothetical protein
MAYLIDDEIRVTPDEFYKMQKAIIDSISADENHYAAACKALKTLGWTDEQIEDRHHRETKIAVVYGWVLSPPDICIATHHMKGPTHD